MLEDGKEKWVSEPFLPFRDPGSMPNYSTDDRGNYRISGLPAGKYIVATTFQLSAEITYFSTSGSGGSSFGNNNQWTNFKIYSGNTTRLKDAAVLSLTAGEEYSGEDLQFPLNKLRTITGHIARSRCRLSDGPVLNFQLLDSRKRAII